MKSEEIKKGYSMKRIVSRYGIKPNRSGFIQCPFHDEKTASMKLYEDSYYCFGCGETGDIFTFVMKMEKKSFKEAYLSLGGTYEKESFGDKLARYHAEKEQEEREKRRLELMQKRKKNNALIEKYRDEFRQSVPLSEAWTNAYNALQYQLYIHDVLNEKGGKRIETVRGI